MSISAYLSSTSTFLSVQTADNLERAGTRATEKCNGYTLANHALCVCVSLLTRRRFFVWQRNWYIQATCATSGEGLYEGLDWLSNQLAKKS